MKYLELTFTITPFNEAATDVLAALLADAGCDTFLPQDDGMKAYILADTYDEAAIREAIANTLAAFSLPAAPEAPSPAAVPETPSPAAVPEAPSPAAVPETPSPAAVPETPSPAAVPEASASGLSISFTPAAAPDENWNATWEAEHHFEPITLPDGQRLQIIPRQAFGSGEHATTQMMLALLGQLAAVPEVSTPAVVPEAFASGSPCPALHRATVIDAGCGTGILGIAALKLGAARVFAYDIDEWSVRNAEENFALNGIVTSTSDPVPGAPLAEIIHGDARCLTTAPQADILMANINRNILLADMSAFVACLKPGGHLLLSGFYETDVPLLLNRATELGLCHEQTLSDGDWRALLLTVNC